MAYEADEDTLDQRGYDTSFSCSSPVTTIVTLQSAESYFPTSGKPKLLVKEATVRIPLGAKNHLSAVYALRLPAPTG